MPDGSSRSWLLAVGLVAVLVVGGAMVVAAIPGPSASPTTSLAPTPTASRGPILPPQPAGLTYRDYLYATTVIDAPTASKAQSKLWFAHGHWWAGLFQPVTNQLNIFRLDPETQLWIDTGTLVDERPFADPDFLWDGEHLYVVTAGPRPSPSNATRVLRYTYDPAAARFALDANFPITIVDSGVTAAVIAIDTTGTLWVTYALDGRVWVAHSLGHHAHWGEPYALPFAQAAVDDDEVAAIVAFGPGQVGVMWSNQRLDSVYFATHQDGTPDDAWQGPEVVVDGLGSSDDHMNLKAYPLAEGTGVAAALKTSLDDGPDVNPLAPLVQLAVRDGQGRWVTHLVGQVRDHHTRAVVMVDEEARVFYVAATAPTRGGVVYYKRSPIDRISFETGVGVPLVASPDDLRINNASSSKQGLDSESDLLVLASDQETGRYLHALLDLGGSGLPTADPADPARLDRPAPPDPRSPVTYINNDFDPWPVGPPHGTIWSVRDGDPADALQIVEADAPGSRALRLSAPTDGEPARACRDFPEVASGRLRAHARVRIDALAPGDTTILSLRGSGGEAATTRITERGVFAWFDGATKVRSEIPARPATWYRVTMVIDPASRTWDLLIASDSGDRLVERANISWRTDVRNVRTICFETGRSASNQSIDLGEVQVLQETAP